MTLDEALSEAVAGARLTADHMQPGSYLCHSFSRGFIRCWPVDRPEDEPNRTQCDWRTHPLDEAADWRILEPDEQYPPVVKNAWGQPKVETKPISVAPTVRVQNKPISAAPPIAAKFCGVCDFTKDKCRCEAAPKKEKDKWGR